MELTTGSILTNRKVLINHKEFRKTFMKRLAQSQECITKTMDTLWTMVAKSMCNALYYILFFMIVLMAYGYWFYAIINKQKIKYKELSIPTIVEKLFI